MPRRGKLSLWLLAAALLAPAPAIAAKVRPGYAPIPGAHCGGYPRAPIGMAKGFCAGVVMAPPPAGLFASKRQIHLPRTLLALPNGAFLVVDLGAWVPGKGAVWLMTPHPGRQPDWVLLQSRLDMPHEAALGPDGRIYVGEMSRIVRFDPAATGPLTSPEVVVDGLPSNRLHPDRHPLTSFIFDADRALLVNIGAGTDQCNDPPPANGEPCAEREGDRPHAAIWRFAYLGDGRWSQTPTVLARGLRNWMRPGAPPVRRDLPGRERHRPGVRRRALRRDQPHRRRRRLRLALLHRHGRAGPGLGLAGQALHLRASAGRAVAAARRAAGPGLLPWRHVPAAGGQAAGGAARLSRHRLAHPGARCGRGRRADRRRQGDLRGLFPARRLAEGANSVIEARALSRST